MKRADLLIPEGWRPKPGVRVGVMATKDDGSPPFGVWRVIDRGPKPNHWWIQPADEKARAWATRFPNALTQGCLQTAGAALAPPDIAEKARRS